MKCDSERPCRHCKEHGKTCVYAELAKKPRPSTSRINQLEQENQRLQETLSNLRAEIETTNNSNEVPSNARLNTLQCGAISSQPSNTSRPCRRPSTHSERPQILTPASLSSDTKTVQRTFSPDKESIYHGPTSTVFDEKTTEIGNRPDTANIAKVPEMWVKSQLVAESARQRQLETVNLIAGKFDFDGVDPELGMHLLSLFWSRQQSSGPIVYRTAFMRDMACAGPYFSKLLLNAIYFYACKHTSRVEVRRDPNNRLTTGWMFRQRVDELLRNDFGKSNITTIQALLLMSTAIFSWCDEKSVSWLYAGMAFNMIIDLGINVNAVILRRQFSEEELEARRRLFWAAYVIDKLQSLYQGRPSCLRESDTNVALIFLDEHEELELFDPLSYAELERSPMSPGEKSGSRNPDDLLHESKSLHAELENWRKSLPPHLDLDPSDPVTKVPLPHMLALLAMFNVLIILLHRPFVSDGHLNSTSSIIALNAFSICPAAAFEIDQLLRTYGQPFCFKATPYIMSYATYVSATIHVRLAAQREHGSDAHKALQRCLDVLEKQQSSCWSPRRAKLVIHALIARMGVVLEATESRAEMSDLTSDFDIDAIIRTFARDQRPAESTAEQLPSGLGAGCMVGSTFNSAFPSSNIVINGSELLNEQTASMTDSDLDLLYDPIFGFNGSAFDDLDFGFGSDLARVAF
ncbi:related to pathway-specific regulatory protein nit-4 [Phialocephala subalpina]|uniref:Related to pathway-specific regulatory protein nit-4 n=1 Tax=Phialocephala subalpina TaxID=576137 RepID=A0A1L7WNA3_9HELO|nr:related to pathway-specific regulatory protein nit-4 [Phialocephala subalpina]